MNKDTENFLEGHHAALLLLDLGERVLNESEVVKSVGCIRGKHQQKVKQHDVLACEIE